MGILSNILKLFMTDMETDGDEYFDFDRDLNDNFKKIDARFAAVDVVVSPLNWVGSEAPYTQEIEVEGMREEINPHAVLVYSDDYETSQIERNEYSKIYDGKSGEGKITLFATSPTGVDLTLRIKQL